MRTIDTLRAAENISGVSGNSNPQWHHRLSQVYRGAKSESTTTPQTSNQQTAPNNQPAVQINIHQVPLGERSQNVSRRSTETPPSETQRSRTSKNFGNDRQEKSDTPEPSSQNTNSEGTTNRDDSRLSDEAIRTVRKLEEREQEVRTHEQAHVAAAGAYATGGINYEYKTGPDGQRYVVSGNVKLDTSPEKTPQETIRKMQQVRAAALAPSNPSTSDMRVAQKAARLIQKAKTQLQEQEQETQQGANSRQAVSVDLSPESQGVNSNANVSADSQNKAGKTAFDKVAAFTENAKKNEATPNHTEDMYEQGFEISSESEKSERENSENAFSTSRSTPFSASRDESENSQHSRTERKIGAYYKPFTSQEASTGNHVRVQAV